MRARVHEMRAKVVEAEAEVPLAMSQAFRDGNLGVMDYYNHEERRLGYGNARFHLTLRRAGRGLRDG